jgi:hypothetical protein
MQIACFQRETDASPMHSIGLLGAAVQLFLAAVLGGIAGGSSAFPNPPELVPRGLAIGLLYAVPAVVAALGAIGGQRSVLAAAALASAIGSVVAFSGVTVIFAVPALLFAVAAGAGGARRLTSSTPTRHVWRLAVFGMLAVPVVVLAVLSLGIFVIPGIVLLVLIVEIARGAAPASLGNRLMGLGIGAVVGGLIIGSGWVLFSMTETRCWAAYQTASGIEYRTMPELPGGEIQPGPDQVAGGCDSGELTPRGAALAALLAGGAIGVAALATRSPGSAAPPGKDDRQIDRGGESP